MKGVIPRAEVERLRALRDACPNCGVDRRREWKPGRFVMDGHFVPPSLGEPGFFYCTKPVAP